MISGSRCRHLNIAGRFDIEVSYPISPIASSLLHIPTDYWESDIMIADGLR